MSSSHSDIDSSDSAEAPKPDWRPRKPREVESVQSSMESDCSHIWTVASSVSDVSEEGIDDPTQDPVRDAEDQVQSGSFVQLPSELITIIAEHLLQTSPTPFPPSKRKQPCPCGYVTGHAPAKKPIKLPTESADASLALSCASKRMREIVFDGQRGRTIALDFCEAAFRNLLFLNPTMRGNVRRLSLHYDYTRCPPASKGNQDVSPCDLLQPWLFPNVDTFNINWRKGLAACDVPVRMNAPTEARSWPSVHHLSVVIDMYNHEENKEVPMLFQHFNFSELQTFSFKLTTSWTFAKSTCAKVAGHIQARNWNRLERAELVLQLWMEDMVRAEDITEDATDVWDALEIAARGVLQGTNINELDLGVVFAFRPNFDLF